MLDRNFLNEIKYSNNLLKYIAQYENEKNTKTEKERKYHSANHVNLHESLVLPTLMDERNFCKYYMKEVLTISEQIDTYLQLLINEQGFSGLPQMVSLDEFNNLAKTQQVYCRGTRIPNAQMLFKHDAEMFIGKGHYANGVYFAKAESVNKIREYNRTGFINENKIVYDNQFLISGVLDKNARVIESDVLDDELEKDCKTLNNNSEINMDKNSLKKFLFCNRGAYAVLKGYDAIIPNTVADRDELILLNRTSMITPKVLRHDFTPEICLKK